MSFTQAGGHKLIVEISNKIFKPTTKAEVDFYINNTSLNEFIPKFYGWYLFISTDERFYKWIPTEIMNKIISKNYTHILILENLIDMTENNFIIDIKLGSRHWLSDTSQEIINNHLERNKNSLTLTHNFRIDGFICNGIVGKEKEDCRNLSINQVSGILSYLNDNTKRKLIIWINNLIDVLKKIDITIYGPSILISGTNDNPRFTLIDFAVYEIGLSDNLLEGLESFKSFLSQ